MGIFINKSQYIDFSAYQSLPKSSPLLQLKPQVLKPKGDFSNFKFEKGSVLENGLSGAVIEATSLVNPLAKVAVKRFTLLGSDGELKKSETFLKEVSIMQNISHAHIVPCVLAAQCPHYLALAMPLCVLSSWRNICLSCVLASLYLSQTTKADAHHIVLGDLGLAVFST